MDILKNGDITTVLLNAVFATFISVLFLLLGNVIYKKSSLIRKLCIPAPVVGGLVFAIINLLLHSFAGVEVEFDETIYNFFALLFFTTLGYAINLGVVKKAGKMILIFFITTVILTIVQNFVAVGISKATGISPLVGLMAGSPSLVGGHSNAAAFGAIAEEWGHEGAVTFGMAASTYGLIAGVMLGNLVAEVLIKRHNLSTVAQDMGDLADESDEKGHMFSGNALTMAMMRLVLTTGVGLVLYVVWGALVPSVTITPLIWGLIVAVFVKIFDDKRGKKLPTVEMQALGKTFLAMFVAQAVASMKLWQLVGLALPLVLILVVNTIITFIFVIAITYRICGRNYDSACIADGQFGFGMGSVIVSVANLDEISKKYSTSKLAYFVVPIVGAMLSNISNALIVSTFMNFLR
ncbi:MAG: hypothetical protein IJJ44_12470 [Solobacterium sp.]|nr:hypothetical protein [Solobacterium sp.]